MVNENTNPLFAYAEARIAAWQAVLASLKSAMALDPGGLTADGIDMPSAATSNGEGQPIDLPEGAFLGKSVPACVKLFLSASKRKKTIKEIASALKDGGVESTSDNFENVVTGALFRLRNNGEVIRFKDGWGLPQWYPAHIRAAAPTTGTNKRSAKKKGKRSGAKKLAKPSLESAGKGNIQPKAFQLESGIPIPPTASERILQLLRTKPEREYSLEEVSQHAKMGVKGTRLALGKLVKAGSAKCSAPGMYAAGKPQLVAAGD